MSSFLEMAPFAVAASAVVHFLNSVFRVGLFWRHVDTALVRRFGVPSIGGPSPAAPPAEGARPPGQARPPPGFTSMVASGSTPAGDQRLLRDFYLGCVRIHVLHHAAQSPIYGVELLEELDRHGYAVGPGMLYPLLHGLEEAGHLTCTPQLVGGRIRKYYAITPSGRSVLAAARQKVGELTRELLEYH